jgi:Domain of unknown function (DUF932)
MSANLFGNRFYGNREPAWHKLGFVSDIDRNAQEALGIIGSYWIEKRPVTITMNGAPVEVGDYALVRSAVPDDPKELNFGYCTKNYNIVQPDSITRLFDDNVKQPVETLGMLGKGEKIFLTWKLPLIGVNGDNVQTFGFVACGYDGKYGASLSIVTTRVVCENTWRAAIQESEANKSQDGSRGRVFAGKHNSANVERDLGIWMEHTQERALAKTSEMETKFTAMDNIKIEDAGVLAGLLFQIYPDPKPLPEDYPDKLRGEKQAKIDEQAEDAECNRNAIEALFNGQGTAINATGWGLFNAVTEFNNYGGMVKKPVEYSILMGNRDKVMTHAFNVINDFVTNQ